MLNPSLLISRLRLYVAKNSGVSRYFPLSMYQVRSSKELFRGVSSNAGSRNAVSAPSLIKNAYGINDFCCTSILLKVPY